MPAEIYTSRILDDAIQAQRRGDAVAADPELLSLLQVARLLDDVAWADLPPVPALQGRVWSRLQKAIREPERRSAWHSLSRNEKWAAAIAGGTALGAVEVALGRMASIPMALACVPSLSMLLTNLGYMVRNRSIRDTGRRLAA